MLTGNDLKIIRDEFKSSVHAVEQMTSSISENLTRLHLSNTNYLNEAVQTLKDAFDLYTKKCEQEEEEEEEANVALNIAAFHLSNNSSNNNNNNNSTSAETNERLRCNFPDLHSLTSPLCTRMVDEFRSDDVQEFSCRDTDTKEIQKLLDRGDAIVIVCCRYHMRKWSELFDRYVEITFSQSEDQHSYIYLKDYVEDTTSDGKYFEESDNE